MSALVSMLRKRLAVTWLGWACCGLALTAIPLTNYLTLQSAMQRMRFVAMDSRDTFYLANLGSFETAQHVREELSKMAAEAMFNRSPDGIDDPERVERLFNPSTAASLQKDVSRDADAFRVGQVHQKWESGQIRELQVDDNTSLLSVEGQLLRHSIFNGRPTEDARKVILFLRLTVNQDMARNGRYPLVVTNYEVRY
jgi:hypothetical protein